MALTFRPLSANIGVEVLGLDIAQPIDAEAAGALRGAMADHLLLLIRGQDITADDQVRFGRIFGDVHLRTKYNVPVAEPLNQFVSNARPDGILGDVELKFHQDHVFYENPLKALILYGIEIPPSGSVTKFRNVVEILGAMPADLRSRMEGVRCLFDGGYTPWKQMRKPDQPRAWRSIIYTDPETGRRSLMASPTTIAEFEDMPEEEGRALLAEVFAFADSATARYSYFHEWRPGDVLIWHNCLVQHARAPFNTSERRTLRRTQVHYTGADLA